LWDFLRLATSNLANDSWHAAHQRVLLRSLGSILWFRLMQFWGTYQGYRHSGPVTWQLRKTFYYPRMMETATQRSGRNVEPIQYAE
jgi:rhamnosyltransferase